ncbi:histidine phosphatase family protein [Streptomyces sp. SCL15-4]|uniref:histidine phosphatase family protein n=1 Tax=Streptomyces sp. SCL15-4 TaxID=2967221 RepID=UPI0039900257
MRPPAGLGAARAAALPGALAAEDTDAVYASTPVRTRRTAAARGLEVIVRDGVREPSAGDLETLPGLTGLRMPAGQSGEAPGRRRRGGRRGRRERCRGEGRAPGARPSIRLPLGPGAAQNACPWDIWKQRTSNTTSPTGGRCWAMSPSGSARAPPSPWSDRTAPARPRCSG